MSREKQELSQLMNKEYKCVLLAASAVCTAVLCGGLDIVVKFFPTLPPSW